jgi:hypothetical protein
MSKLLKSKKSLYFLIPLLLLVWGLIIVRAIKLTSVPEIELSSNKQFSFTADSLPLKPLEKLVLRYRDPFLAQAPIQADIQNESYNSLFYTDPEPQEKPVQWPELKYQGIVANGVKRFAIIQMGKKRLIKGKKDILLDAFTIRQFYNDSIVVSYNSKTKTYTKQ